MDDKKSINPKMSNNFKDIFFDKNNPFPPELVREKRSKKEICNIIADYIETRKGRLTQVLEKKIKDIVFMENSIKGENKNGSSS